MKTKITSEVKLEDVSNADEEQLTEEN